jgi:hypothetical protein
MSHVLVSMRKKPQWGYLDGEAFFGKYLEKREGSYWTSVVNVY